jgi:3-isopropylmalate/(R)-2-methylmalate dehydratase small subunit
MEAFTKLTAVAAPLMRDNVDTDAIIPSREMRSVSRKGLSDGLFAGWRYTEIGGRDADPNFVLNNSRYANTRFIVSGGNFGCGSSREHAVWALAEYGVKAVLAESFNPIFRGNCINNGVVPVVLHRGELDIIAAWLERTDTPVLTVDLEAQHIEAADELFAFQIEADARHALLNGLDPIGQTLVEADNIQAFRQADALKRPWIYTTVQR